MPFTPAAHSPYQWDNAPATDTPLDSSHLEASEQDLITYVQSVTASLDSYLEALLAPIVSPTFTGFPAAPTPATSDNSTKLATTAFVKTVASGLLAKLPIATTSTSSNTAVAGSHNPYNVTGGSVTATLPTGQAAGTLLGVEKFDSSGNTVTVSGNIRTVGAQTIVLSLSHETILLEADSTGSWWPLAGHKTLSSLDGRYVQSATPVTTANEILPLATPTYSSSITPNFLAGRWQTITVTNATAFTIGAPTNAPTSSQTSELGIEIFNNSGGVMGAVTWNGAFVFPTGSWTNPASTKRRFARFNWNGTNWICTTLASSDY